MSSLGRSAFTLVGLLGAIEFKTGVPLAGESLPKPFMPGSSGALGIVGILRASPTPGAGIPGSGTAGRVNSAVPPAVGWAALVEKVGVGLYLLSRQFLQLSQPTTAIPAQIRPTITTTGFLPIGIPFTFERASEPRMNPRAIRNHSPHPTDPSLPRTGLTGG